MTKNAFTLVELAIVLVIIGLLTAGVVGGQSLIESAKLQSVITDMKKYKTVVKAFQLEYGALPGDMTDATLYWGKSASACNGHTGTAATPGTCNGDGDKTFDYTLSSTEPARTWQHLSLAGLIPGTYSGLVANHGSCISGGWCYVPGTDNPTGPIDGSGWTLLYSSNWGKNYGRNILLFGNPQNLTGDGYEGSARASVLTPKQLKSIDQKIDDGKPNGGIITNINDYGTAVGYGNPQCTELSSGILSYKLSRTDIVCNLIYDID